MFFSYRVYIMSKKVYLIVITTAINLYGVGSQLFLGVVALTGDRSLVTLREKYNWAIMSVLIAHICVDVMNASSLCIYLAKDRGRFNKYVGWQFGPQCGLTQRW